MLAIDEDERSMFNIGRQGEVNIVNEPGLYRLIFKSNRPEAKKFQKWIYHEVLPQIRKTGVYKLRGPSIPGILNPFYTSIRYPNKSTSFNIPEC